MKKIIELGKISNDLPSACFIASDLMACGALQYLYEQGMRVPRDISIIGYDNTLAMISSPPISSIAFPVDEIGKSAIELIKERREKRREVSKTITLSPQFIDRNTVNRF